jgi:hypothetical protein
MPFPSIEIFSIDFQHRLMGKTRPIEFGDKRKKMVGDFLIEFGDGLIIFIN